MNKTNVMNVKNEKNVTNEKNVKNVTNEKNVMNEKNATNKMKAKTLFFFTALLLLCASCRKDDDVVMPTIEESGHSIVSDYQGLYVLCEGNMGANKATLDYLDLATGRYHQNIFPSRNPQQVKELGDVGNDAKIYGSRLWLVINCSNKVEVCDAVTARSVGHVNIPNCRYLAFHEGYAYVSSYVGPLGGTSVQGSVYKVDTLTLQVVARVGVGYQPEELTVSNGKLYVANSGGYNAMQGRGYDRTVSVIDLKRFAVEETIDVAPNLFRLRSDRFGQLWVSSRSTDADATQNINEQHIPPRLYLLNGHEVAEQFNIDVSDFCFRGDSLCYLAISNGGYETGVIDIVSHRVVSRQLIKPSSEYSIETPYGIIVHPTTGHIFVMDATNYVSNGWLLCFDADGNFLWKASTGDIPGHAVFLPKHASSTSPAEPTPPIDPSAFSKYIQAVDEYVPAPGQFVNLMPVANENDTPESMAQKCTEAIAGGKGNLITLGAWGGYITFHFDHPIANVPGQRDFAVWGNAFNNNAEPAIVMVSQDSNGNGKPDDEWFELRGSVYNHPNTIHNYQLTYSYDAMNAVPWSDNQGNKGSVPRNTYHQQEYFPLWLKDRGTLTFSGCRLPDNARLNGSVFELPAFDYGYADNKANTDTLGCSMDIGWAVNVNGEAVNLTHIHFIRCYNAMNQVCGSIGETSTEIKGAEDLHLEESIKIVNSLE